MNGTAVSKAATARGLGPCGPRQSGCPVQPHPPLRSGYRHHQAPAAAPASLPPSLLHGRNRYLPPPSAVISDRSPVCETHGGSGPRPSALGARPLGCLPCKAHPRRPSLTSVSGSYTDGKLHLCLAASTSRAAQLQTRAANGGAAAAASPAAAGDEDGLGSGSSNNMHTGTHSFDATAAAAPDASAAATARLLRGALEAALLPRLEAMEERILERIEGSVVEAMEGRIMEAVEGRILQKIMDVEQRREDEAESTALRSELLQAGEGQVAAAAVPATAAAWVDQTSNIQPKDEPTNLWELWQGRLWRLLTSAVLFLCVVYYAHTFACAVYTFLIACKSSGMDIVNRLLAIAYCGIGVVVVMYADRRHR